MEANYFTRLYWFCHTSTWIRQGCTHVPHPEQPPTALPIPSLWVIQCTSPKHPVSCIKPGLAIHFTYDNIHVSLPFSQIIPPSPSSTESIQLVKLSEMFIMLYFLFWGKVWNFLKSRLGKKNLLILFHPTNTLEQIYPKRLIKVTHKDVWKNMLNTTRFIKLRFKMSNNTWPLTQSGTRYILLKIVSFFHCIFVCQV